MAFGKYIVKILAYDDSATSNDPQEINFSWYQEFAETILTPDATSKSLPVGSTTISLAAASQKWLFILTDQDLQVKINGSTDVNFTVKPSAAGTQDGVLLQRVGTLTSLVLVNTGAAAANAKIFTSA
jgi:hypothetical protein